MMQFHNISCLHSALFLCLGGAVYSGGTRAMLEYFHNIGFPCPQLENPLMYYLCLSTVDRRWVDNLYCFILFADGSLIEAFAWRPQVLKLYPSFKETSTERENCEKISRPAFTIPPSCRPLWYHPCFWKVRVWKLSIPLPLSHVHITSTSWRWESWLIHQHGANDVQRGTFFPLLLLLFSFHIDSQYSFSFHEMCDGRLCACKNFLSGVQRGNK